MRWITLGGPELAGFTEGCGGAHLKLFLQRPGQAERAQAAKRAAP